MPMADFHTIAAGNAFFRVNLAVPADLHLYALLGTLLYAGAAAYTFIYINKSYLFFHGLFKKGRPGTMSQPALFLYVN